MQKMIQAHEEIKAEKKATPQSEVRPAAVTSHKKHSVQSPKAEMIKGQGVATDKAVESSKAAKPEVEARPAATAKHN